MTYHKINAPFKRWQKNLHTEDMLPEGTGYGDFKVNEFSAPEFEYLFDNQWEWSEKLDGTNIRIYINDEGMSVAGRTENADIPAKLYDWIHEWYKDKKDALHMQFPQGVIFYGEGVGSKIQKGGLFGEPHFKLFDVYISEFWLEKNAVAGIGHQFGLDTPSTWTGTMQEAIDKVRTKPKSTFGDFIIEGYVGVPTCRIYNGRKNRIITKIKVRDFKGV